MSLSAAGAPPSGSASGLDLLLAEGPGATLTGLLRHNASDQRGAAPYMLVDRWGVVRGYVSPKPGLELEPYLGQQITLKGAMRRLPAGDMPLLTAETVGWGGKSTAVASYATAAASGGSSVVRQIDHQEPLPTPVPEQPIRPVPAESLRPLQPMSDPPQPSDFGGDPMAGDPYLEEPGCGPAWGPGCGAGCGPSRGPCCGPCGPCCGPCCGSCGPCCGPCCGELCGPCGAAMCRGPAGLWVNTELLLWWMRGMHVPPLVTTGSLNDAQPGALGQPGTQIVFGDEDINDRLRAGGRLQFGWWLDCCRTVGLEGEYFGLGQATTHFRQWSDGNPTLFRPFYNEDPNTGNGVGERAEEIAVPRANAAGLNSIDGAASVDALSRLQGAAARLRFALGCGDSCWSDCWTGRTFHDSFRSSWTLGYRFLRLDDRLGITEQLTSTVTGEQGAFLIQDQFSTNNQFNGAELGLQFKMQRNRWSLEVSPRIALGDTHETGVVSGFTRTTDPTTGAETFATGNAAGGLLTKVTNMGLHSRDAFGAVPELTLKLGYQVTQHTRATIGYDFLAWSEVVRAGDQIDLNTTLPGVPPGSASPTSPVYPYRTSAFWAQGFDFGLEFRW